MLVLLKIYLQYLKIIPRISLLFGHHKIELSNAMDIEIRSNLFSYEYGGEGIET